MVNDLRTHLKMHSGEKSNKCIQCEYASDHESALREHLKIHQIEKPNKCNLCNYASSYASNLKKRTLQKNQIIATNVILSALKQAI